MHLKDTTLAILKAAGADIEDTGITDADRRVMVRALLRAEAAAVIAGNDAMVGATAAGIAERLAAGTMTKSRNRILRRWESQEQFDAANEF